MTTRSGATKARTGAALLGLVALYVGMLALLAATPADQKAGAASPASAAGGAAAAGSAVAASGQAAAAAAAAPAAAVEKPAPDRVVVYYFHTTQRCATCRRIEEWSGLALRSAFADDLADSSLVFVPVNTDEKANQHFLKDYQLYTKSLIVSDTKDGAQLGWENLQKVWEFAGSQEKFFAYVQGEVRKHLAAVPKRARG